MQFKTLLFICSALITTAHSFPTGPEDDITTSLPQKETTALDTKENKKPLVFIMEEKDPKSDSVVVQFIYSSNGGNSIIESKGSDKEKYVVDNQTHKEKLVEKSYEKEKEKEKSVKASKTNKTADDQNAKPNSKKDVQMAELTPLTSEEASPISGKLPKYLDALSPVYPFPELQFGKPNQISIDQVQSESANSYLPYYAKEKKEPLNVAGPQLSPLSMYDREFNVPIFD